MAEPKIQTFIDHFRKAVADRSMVRMTLGNPAVQEGLPKNLIFTVVKLRKGLRLQVVERFATRDITKNHSFDEGFLLAARALENDFRNADLICTDHTLHFLAGKDGVAKIRRKEHDTAKPVSFTHDRTRDRLVATEGNAWLRELGILNDRFEVRHEMSDKYVQINRYLELLSPHLKAFRAGGQIRVTDMGAGKGYLTFALYDHLKRSGYDPLVTGVEARPDLVKKANDTAARAGFTRLHFVAGTIAEAEIPAADILIALHACDTATDDAIFRGINAGASLIVVAPCCHKQVRKEFRVTGAMKTIMKHGILEERQAEIITDGIRSLLLEVHGYKTSVFEFISTEHTPKNLMIVGRKSVTKPYVRMSGLTQIKEVKSLFGIRKHYLETLMEGLPVAPEKTG